MYLYLLLGLIMGGIIVYYLLKPQLNKTIEKNNKILKENQELEKNKILLNENIKSLLDKQSTLNDSIKNLSDQAKTSANVFYEFAMKDVNNKLEKEKIETEKAINKYNEEYLDIMQDVSLNIQKELEELNKIKKTRESLIQANLREKEIQEQKDFYCLHLDPIDEADIKMLEKVKLKLNKPRILSMLIWSTFFQGQMTQLCNNVLKGKKVCGIYKITNLKTNECYIGQARDIATRWKEHCKCGLGIDTPARNKLYKAMQEYSLTNFSFELLEECSIEQLNEKEYYYIDLYDSVKFGYNTLKGVKG